MLYSMKKSDYFFTLKLYEACNYITYLFIINYNFKKKKVSGTHCTNSAIIMNESFFFNK